MKGLEVRDLKDIQKYLEKNLHEDAFHYNEFRQMRKLLVKLINIIDFRKKKNIQSNRATQRKMIVSVILLKIFTLVLKWFKIRLRFGFSMKNWSLKKDLDLCK